MPGWLGGCIKYGGCWAVYLLYCCQCTIQLPRCSSPARPLDGWAARNHADRRSGGAGRPPPPAAVVQLLFQLGCRSLSNGFCFYMHGALTRLHGSKKRRWMFEFALAVAARAAAAAGLAGPSPAGPSTENFPPSGLGPTAPACCQDSILINIIWAAAWVHNDATLCRRTQPFQAHHTKRSVCVCFHKGGLQHVCTDG